MPGPGVLLGNISRRLGPGCDGKNLGDSKKSLRRSRRPGELRRSRRPGELRRLQEPGEGLGLEEFPGGGCGDGHLFVKEQKLTVSGAIQNTVVRSIDT